MRMLKTLASVGLAAGLAAAVAAPADAQQRITIGTGGTGGLFYVVGAGMAELINNHMEGATARAEVTGASVERILRPLATKITAEGAERFRGRLRRWGGDLPYLVALATNFGPDASAAHIDHITRISSDAPIEVWTHMLRSLIDMDLRHALGHIAVPALVVVGDRDALTPKTSAVAIRRALPDARAYVLTRAGHLAMMERHQVFNELLEEHLDRVFARERAAG